MLNSDLDKLILLLYLLNRICKIENEKGGGVVSYSLGEENTLKKRNSFHKISHIIEYSYLEMKKY